MILVDAHSRFFYLDFGLSLLTSYNHDNSVEQGLSQEMIKESPNLLIVVNNLIFSVRGPSLYVRFGRIKTVPVLKGFDLENVINRSII